MLNDTLEYDEVLFAGSGVDTDLRQGPGIRCNEFFLASWIMRVSSVRYFTQVEWI